MCSLQDHRNYIARDSKVGPVLLSVKTEEDYQGTMMRALLRYVGTVIVVCCMCGQCTCLTVLCAIIVLCVDSPSLFIGHRKPPTTRRYPCLNFPLKWSQKKSSRYGLCSIADISTVQYYYLQVLSVHISNLPQFIAGLHGEELFVENAIRFDNSKVQYA